LDCVDWLDRGRTWVCLSHFFKEVQYTSKLTFAIEEKSGGGGSLLGLASQFGVDLGGVGFESGFSGFRGLKGTSSLPFWLEFK
jgi:hypothetical protein